MPIRFLTAGESHGKALLCILEGIPANLESLLGSIVRVRVINSKPFNMECELLEVEHGYVGPVHSS